MFKLNHSYKYKHGFIIMPLYDEATEKAIREKIAMYKSLQAMGEVLAAMGKDVQELKPPVPLLAGAILASKLSGQENLPAEDVIFTVTNFDEDGDPCFSCGTHTFDNGNVVNSADVAFATQDMYVFFDEIAPMEFQ